jgi:hypothetical protein
MASSAAEDILKGWKAGRLGVLDFSKRCIGYSADSLVQFYFGN